MTCRRVLVTLALAATSLAGCKPGDSPDPRAAPVAAMPADAAPTNRVDVPAPVRQNLGITFATVERRRVAQTLRVPGVFELLPSARREYRASSAGRVELAVTQFDRVEPGALLYRLDSGRWRELQDQLAAAEAALDQAQARMASMGPLRAAHRKHEESLSNKVDLWTRRVEELKVLREAGGGAAKDLAEASGTLNATQAELADVMEKDAALASRDLEIQAEVRGARSRFDLLLDTATTMTGVARATLAAPTARPEDGAGADAPPAWRTIERIDVRAQAPGVVETIALSTGGLVEQGGLVLTTIQPDHLRFRAKALQADLSRLRDGLPALVVPPSGASMAMQDTMPADLALGLTANPDERTVDLFASVPPEAIRTWARAGVSGFLEITLAGGDEELAIPASSVVRDGATPIIFRRDPANPDKVIRMEADVGITDGRWIVINSGVGEGDEIVLDGAYPLLLATSGSAQKGGHFHADGTFHEGED